MLLLSISYSTFRHLLLVIRHSTIDIDMNRQSAIDGNKLDNDDLEDNAGIERVDSTDSFESASSSLSASSLASSNGSHPLDSPILSTQELEDQVWMAIESGDRSLLLSLFTSSPSSIMLPLVLTASFANRHDGSKFLGSLVSLGSLDRLNTASAPGSITSYIPIHSLLF
jgi:hypothetical protein